MNYLIIGANSELAIRFVELNLSCTNNFYLISANLSNLKRNYKNHINKYNQNIKLYELNAIDHNFLEQLVKIYDVFKPSCIFIAMAKYFDKDDLSNTTTKICNLYLVNLIVIVNFITFISNKYKNRKITFILFGSIASSIGRNNNIFYSSAKRGLDSFIESFFLSNTNHNMYYYILGFMDVLKTKNKKIRFPHGSTMNLVKKITDDINDKRKSFICYYPMYWYFIVSLIKFLPIKFKLIFNKYNR